MGITGLLKGLQCFTNKGHVRDFSNQALAIDASSWLHKSVYSVSERYVESMERHNEVLDPTCIQVSTNYILNRCQELWHHANIAHIYLVLDGLRCPLKAVTNREREDRRRQALLEARQYQKDGLKHKAEERYKMCIKITSTFASAVMQSLQQRLRRIDPLSSRLTLVWAPYEADAQLIKLGRDGLINAIVTEVCIISFPTSFSVLFILLLFFCVKRLLTPVL
jgi:5'-3' exonuclease